MAKQRENGISWTDETWNPLRGCTRVSEGCRNCYAEGVAARFSKPGQPYEGLASFVGADRLPRWTGKVALVEHMLDQPLRWRKPRRIFVNSMSDLFHESVPDEWIDKIFAVMALCPEHTFQVLTKRPERMRAYLGVPGPERAARGKAIFTAAKDLIGERDLPERFAPLSADTRNIWTGMSAEDQQRFDERWEHLKHCRIGWGNLFLSGEPLLGALDLRFQDDHCDLCGGTGLLARWPKGKCHVCGGRGRVTINGPRERDGYYRLDWIIVGGESGPNARPMHPDWVRSLRDQCTAAGTAFFFKKWGEWVSVSEVDGAGAHFHFEDGATVRRVGKKSAGHLIDGREHREFPA